jgi:hypothetical protein
MHTMYAALHQSNKVGGTKLSWRPAHSRCSWLTVAAQQLLLGLYLLRWLLAQSSGAISPHDKPIGC